MADLWQIYGRFTPGVGAIPPGDLRCGLGNLPLVNPILAPQKGWQRGKRIPTGASTLPEVDGFGSIPLLQMGSRNGYPTVKNLVGWA